RPGRAALGGGGYPWRGPLTLLEGLAASPPNLGGAAPGIFQGRDGRVSLAPSMPALLAPLVGFSLGVLFSWAAAEELARSGGPLGGARSFSIVVLFSLLIYGPFSGYFLTYATDWSLAYLVDGRRVPSALLLI